MSEKRIALVTGGTGGIGTAICRRLADEGYQVVAGYYHGGKHEAAQIWQELQCEDGYDISLQYGNVADFDDCRRMVADIEERFGPISLLVNNAGVTRDGTLRKMSEDHWRVVLETNLFSVFNLSRHLVDGMMQRGFGRIINVASINGDKGQFGQTNYSAAKAGMHGFTKALAQEVASKGVTVNTVSPGYTETPMVLAIAPEIREQIRRQIPVGRLGRPEEIARAVAFLAAPESGFITGANLPVNGGHYMH
ncbi:MAG: acetoacetyl-CoA reductase [Fluviicoccus sp.]|uniref:acetoacetyl-CoA reductase n=1 Tax=Fluviicoccus sp. TaxID=2003552 RepID=UPI00271BB060|nr:acetoacetyl-CoA reductase [Fluviicoccus sp.]MDO8329447.1 acetoacetyl-CoA reductase [Fluviicoccus sp.]